MDRDAVCRALVTLALAIACLVPALTVASGSREEVVTLKVRGDESLSMLIVRGPAPRAAMILFTGSDGYLGLGPKGIGRPSRNFLVRNRQTFAARGFVVAVPDAPSDYPDLYDLRTEPWHARDIARIVRWLREETGLPVILVGTSRGSLSAAFAAAQPQASGASGLVLVAPITERGNHHSTSLDDVELERITVPVLLVQHRDDECYVTPASGARALSGKLNHAASVTYRELTGGKAPESGDCDPLSAHGFHGLDTQAVDLITRWAGEKVAPPPAPAAERSSWKTVPPASLPPGYMPAAPMKPAIMPVNMPTTIRIRPMRVSTPMMVK